MEGLKYQQDRSATPLMPFSSELENLDSDLDVKMPWNDDDLLGTGGALLDGGDAEVDDEENFQALLASRIGGSRSPAAASAAMMRGSYSLNDLTLLQQQCASQPAWNHKLVSVKPKLEPVPEGGPSLMPSLGGPLNLMPLGNCQPNSQPTTAGGSTQQGSGQRPPLPTQAPSPHTMPQSDFSQKQQQKCQAAAAAALQKRGDSPDYVDNDTTSSESIPRSFPSTNMLSAQLQMTHVRSETQLSGLSEQQQQQQHFHTGMVPVQGVMGGATAQGSTAAAVEAFRQSCAIPTYSMLHGAQQGEGEAMSAAQHHSAARRAPSGLPLRKSQSAVELGSWRSFSSPEEYWDSLGQDGQASMGHANQCGGPDERLAKIQRYRERRVQRGAHARMPNYQPIRMKASGTEGRLQHGAMGLHSTLAVAPRRIPRSSSSSRIWGSDMADSSGKGHAQEQQQLSPALVSAQPLYAQAYSVNHNGGHSFASNASLHPHLQQRGPQQFQHPFRVAQEASMYSNKASEHAPPLYPPSHTQHSSQQPYSQQHSHQLHQNHSSPRPLQQIRSSQRNHSFQGLLPASYIPPSPPPSNLKFSMVGGGSHQDLLKCSASPVLDGSSSPYSCSAQSSPSLSPSVMAHPPRMLAPCLPPAHPMAGPRVPSGGIFVAGSLSQQVSPSPGALYLGKTAASLSGTPMHVQLAHMSASGQTIFSVSSALKHQQAQQQQAQQQEPELMQDAPSAHASSPIAAHGGADSQSVANDGAQASPMVIPREQGSGD